MKIPTNEQFADSSFPFEREVTIVWVRQAGLPSCRCANIHKKAMAGAQGHGNRFDSETCRGTCGNFHLPVTTCGTLNIKIFDVAMASAGHSGSIDQLGKSMLK